MRLTKNGTGTYEFKPVHELQKDPLDPRGEVEVCRDPRCPMTHFWSVYERKVGTIEVEWICDTSDSLTAESIANALTRAPEGL